MVLKVLTNVYTSIRWGCQLVGPRHPSKEIEAAVSSAEDNGWTCQLSSGHAWGRLLCGLQHARRLSNFGVVDAEKSRGTRPSHSEVRRSLPACERMTMKKYTFTIIASGLDPTAADFEDRFFRAGCGDATIAFMKGVIVLEFEREASSFAHALISAVHDVQCAGAAVQHIEPDYLVSLSDIAERCNLSRSAVSLFTKGERREGFPPPVARVTTDSPLWDWVHVARWMYRNRRVSLEAVVQAKIVRDANRAVLETHGRIEHSRLGKRFLVELSC
jgi:hypothetical protein